jgi:UDP-N-acetylglucosamine 4-epimerase
MNDRTRYEEVQDELRARPRRWLVTGCAGFIGSHLLEKLLQLDQTVVGLDNLSSGTRANLEEVRSLVSAEQWARFDFKEGDIRSLADCQSASLGAEYILHQAALGSVPRSINQPLLSHGTNVDGTINLLEVARSSSVKKFVYASSSSVYGDDPKLPKEESRIGRPLSPYAATKQICEIYASVYTACYGIETIGLRYFNVFGPRQSPQGPYAAVIAKWSEAAQSGSPIVVNGDGSGSRDFCFVENIVQGNLLAALSRLSKDCPTIFNIGCGARITLESVIAHLGKLQNEALGRPASIEVIHQSKRPGDVAHSQADIGLAKAHLGYAPSHSFAEGMLKMNQYLSRKKRTFGGTNDDH